MDEIRKTVAYLMIMSSLFVGGMEGLDYLGKKYVMHKEKMRNDPGYEMAYNFHALKEREQADKELAKFTQDLMHAWKDKNTIPGLEYLLNSLKSNPEPAP